MIEITAIHVVFFKKHKFKVPEYPFKENENTLKDMQVLLYIHFYNMSLNVLRPNFLDIYNLPISHFPNISNIRVKVGPKTIFPTLCALATTEL